MGKKICAIIVTYNPNIKDLKKSVERILREVDKVIICNNSDYDISIEIPKVECVNFQENVGIALAQSIGMKKAFDDYNFDFIIQFDQDSLMDSEMIKRLIKVYNFYYEKKICTIIGPQDYDKDTLVESSIKFFNKKQLKEKNILEVETLISSGCLISKDVYYKIGKMKDEWFIDIVDFEYCWRAKKKGIKVLKVKDAKLSHKLGNGKIKTKFGFKINIGSPIRHYYQFRNILYATTLDYVPLKWKFISILKILFKICFYKILLEDGEIRVHYMKKGIKDFIDGKKGKITNND